MLFAIVMLAAGTALYFSRELEGLHEALRSWRMEDHSGYSTRELRKITASVQRRDRRRSRYGINA